MLLRLTVFTFQLILNISKIFEAAWMNLDLKMLKNWYFAIFKLFLGSNLWNIPEKLVEKGKILYIETVDTHF